MNKRTYISWNHEKHISPRKLVVEIITEKEIIPMQLESTKEEICNLLCRHIPTDIKIIDINIISFHANDKLIPSYNTEHIELRYCVARKYYPYDFLETGYKTEIEISEIYTKFLKSLKPPFNQEP